MIRPLALWLERQSDGTPLLVTCSSEKILTATHAQMVAATQDSINLAADNQTISIGQVRQAIHTALSTSWAGQRIIFIPQAELLTVPASSALLKLLEESPLSTRCVLMTRWPARLLPTIISRCQRVRLPAPFMPPSKPKQSWQPMLLARLAEHTSKDGLLEADLALISNALSWQVHYEPPRADIRRALRRLRDYYYIQATRGNRKLAADVLLASLP